jgi:hypothetical protein
LLLLLLVSLLLHPPLTFAFVGAFEFAFDSELGIVDVVDVVDVVMEAGIVAEDLSEDDEVVDTFDRFFDNMLDEDGFGFNVSADWGERN